MTDPKMSEKRLDYFLRAWADHAGPLHQWPHDESFEAWFGKEIPCLFQTIDSLQAEIARLNLILDEAIRAEARKGKL